MNGQKSVPFSKGYVLRATKKHMLRSIDISVSKSFERLKEFEGDGVKGTEILETLSVLQSMKKLIEDFEKHNEHLFKGE